MRIWEIALGKAQRGWTVKMAVTIDTRRQYTSETHVVESSAKHMPWTWLTILIAVFNGWGTAKKLERELQAIEGPFEIEKA